MTKLEQVGVAISRRSTVIETEPLYVLEQPRFLNLVVEAETQLDPLALLEVVQKIEVELGRVRVLDKGPRAIDIDILFYGNRVVRGPGLVIPHPLLQERLFVLQPLCELAPDLRHPVLGLTARELCSALTT